MKGMKGRFLRKLKSVSSITSLRGGIFFQVNPSTETDENNSSIKEHFPSRVIEIEAVNHVEDEAMDSPFHVFGKENFAKENAGIPMELEYGSTNGYTVPLSAEKSLNGSETCDLQPNPIELMAMEHDSAREFLTLADFEEHCPPGGNEQVILYTTSLRGIRKTFEDCNKIRFLLESFRILYYERDVSMHLEFREELWQILGGKVAPPRLFIKGRHIGGADRVVELHEQGRLRKLFHGLPVSLSGTPCKGCGGFRFVVCFSCSGSRKVTPDELTDKLSSVRCLECNENGLIKCPICC